MKKKKKRRWREAKILNHWVLLIVRRANQRTLPYEVSWLYWNTKQLFLNGSFKISVLEEKWLKIGTLIKKSELLLYSFHLCFIDVLIIPSVCKVAPIKLLIMFFWLFKFYRHYRVYYCIVYMLAGVI